MKEEKPDHHAGGQAVIAGCRKNIVWDEDVEAVLKKASITAQFDDGLFRLTDNGWERI